MTDGDRRAFLQEQQGHRFADDVAAADHDGMPTLRIHPLVLEDLHHAKGRAGHKTLLAAREQAHVRRMQSVDVFRRSYGFEYPLCRKLRRQRELHQYAVDTGVVVEGPNTPEERRLIRVGRQFDVLRVEPRFAACLDLVPHIDFRSRAIPDLYHRETGTHTPRGERCDTSNQPHAQLSRDGVAVNGAGMHGESRGEHGRRAF